MWRNTTDEDQPGQGRNVRPSSHSVHSVARNRYPNLSVPVHATEVCLFFILESSSVLVRKTNPLDDTSGHAVDRVNGNEARVAQQGQATDTKVRVEDIRHVSGAI